MIEHYVEELTEEKDEWRWAVKWKDKVICVARKEEWANQIAWALDYAKPYEGNKADQK